MSDKLNGPSPEQLDTLIQSIQLQSDEVIRLRKQTTHQSDTLAASNNIIKWVIRVIIVALLVSCYGIYEARHANDLIEQSNRNLQERSIASCLNQNDFYQKHNKLVSEDEETLRLAFSNAQSEQAQEFLTQRIGAYELNKVKLRNCTPSGIEKYLSTTTTSE